ncbi:apolipoprotein D-like [Tetranychus urticae]|uniref:Lipocalin/cytosolic fatty-acid binding domain-containing protein n=1 Tax=Tetranychus urticae TaxID=32264 RepID=T1K7A8_TETUR|nr:apolipoprotein D-like [Tetranychus urticae]
MKQFFVLCVFSLSFAPVFETRDLSQHNAIRTFIAPAGCPEPTRLPQPFDLAKYLGDWYEIKSTGPIFEYGLRCTQFNYKLDNATGNIAVNETGVIFSGQKFSSLGVAVPSAQDNVYSIKFPNYATYGQYWVVDTDYTNYALVVSCYTAFSHDVWILSRKPTLDDGIVEKLVAKLDSVGIHNTKLSETIQNC